MPRIWMSAPLVGAALLAVLSACAHHPRPDATTTSVPSRDSAASLRPPERVGPYVMRASQPMGEDAPGMLYRYADTTETEEPVTRITVFVYPARDSATTPEARWATAAEQGQAFLASMPIGVERGWYDAYEAAFSDPDSVVVTGRTLPGNFTVATTRKGEAQHVEFQLVYLIERRFLKVRATIPVATWERTTVRRFAQALAMALAEQVYGTP